MNRWVGIVSLRETAPPTPVHRIALAIDAAQKRTSYQLASQKVSYARMRSALRKLGQEHARHYEWQRYEYCVDLAGDFFDGGRPPSGLPSWLTKELQNFLAGRSGAPPTGRRRAQAGSRRTGSRPVQQRPASTRRSRTTPSETDRLARPVRSAPPATRPRSSFEPVRPYSRAERRLDVHDVTYPALCVPPVSVVGVYGQEVGEIVGKAVGGWEASPEVTAWLGLATEHRSHLFESHHADQVTPHVLGLLDRLGASALDVILLDAYTRWATPRNSANSRANMPGDAPLPTLRSARGLPGRGWCAWARARRSSPRGLSSEGVARQILGVLSLCAEHEIARKLVASVWHARDLDRPSAGTVADPVTVAQTAFQKEGLTFDYDEEGPDHRKTFRAAVRTGTGLTAEGSGQSKKAARAAAAQALLEAHPKAIASASPGRKAAPANLPAASPRSYAQPGNRHRDAVSDLAAMFELGHRADGFLAQALTTSPGFTRTRRR